MHRRSTAGYDTACGAGAATGTAIVVVKAQVRAVCAVRTWAAGSYVVWRLHHRGSNREGDGDGVTDCSMGAGAGWRWHTHLRRLQCAVRRRRRRTASARSWGGRRRACAYTGWPCRCGGWWHRASGLEHIVAAELSVHGATRLPPIYWSCPASAPGSTHHSHVYHWSGMEQRDTARLGGAENQMTGAHQLAKPGRAEAPGGTLWWIWHG